MNRANSRELINQIMALNAPVMGTMASSAGFFGAISNKQQAVLDVKKLAANYVAETQKAAPDPAKLAGLTNQIEAGLRTLHALNIINPQKLTQILKLLR